jgi:hypothetical protein
MHPSAKTWRPLLRELKRARPEDVSGVLEKLSESERATLLDAMEGRKRTVSPAAPPSPPSPQVETVRLAGLSSILTARLFPPSRSDAASPRVTPLAQATLQALAEGYARTAIGADDDQPIRLQPGRRRLFQVLLESRRTQVSAQT